MQMTVRLVVENAERSSGTNTLQIFFILLQHLYPSLRDAVAGSVEIFAEFMDFKHSAYGPYSEPAESFPYPSILFI
jgi:hypothetical protein